MNTSQVNCIRSIDQLVDGRMGCLTLLKTRTCFFAPRYRGTLKLARSGLRLPDQNVENGHSKSIYTQILLLTATCDTLWSSYFLIFEASQHCVLHQKLSNHSQGEDVIGEGKKKVVVEKHIGLVLTKRRSHCYVLYLQPSTSIATATFGDTISFLFHPYGVANHPQISALEFPSACEPHNIPRIVLLPDLTKSLQMLAIHSLQRCSKQRIVDIRRRFLQVLPVLDPGLDQRRS